MTSQRRPETPSGALRLPPLPDPPRKSDLQENIHFDRPATMHTLAHHLGALRDGATTFIAGRGYLCRRRSDLPACPYPDMMVAFNVPAAEIEETNGYVIDEVGKAPDLVLEVASSSTGDNDYRNKRRRYAELGVPEYWRFDHTGGRYHGAALAGDRLAPSGVYRPVDMYTESGGEIWGYSEALGLSLCWVNRRLLFWDRANRRYLPDLPEAEARADTEAARAYTEAVRADTEAVRADVEAARADTEAARADAAIARIRELEDQLRERNS